MYTPLSTIGAELSSLIRATGAFHFVEYAQASNGFQVWTMLDAMANLPAAVVAIGTVDYENEALKRTIRPMIFLVGEFNRFLDGDAAGIWDLAEQVLGVFLPRPTEAGLERREVCGIDFIPEQVSPIESEENVSACCVTLSGIEFMSE